MNWVWKAPAVASSRTRALAGGFSASFSSASMRAGGHDLAGGVAVGRDQVEVIEAGEHLGLVAAEHGGHAGGLERAGLGHLGAAGGGQRDGVVGGDDAGDRVGGDLADRMAGDDGLGVGEQAALACSSWWASSVAATTRGWVTAVSVISSAVAVVPRRARSRPLTSDQAASCSAAPGSSSHGDEHAGGLRTLSGSEQRKHGVWARIKRTL